MASTGEDAIANDTAKLSISNDQFPPPLSRPVEDPSPIEPSRASRTIVEDVTEQFAKASAALTTGQLVKDEHFTLFESVGALEIMDPKMDSGYLAPGESLEDDYDIMRELLPEEVLGIMDQLLGHEMAWHMGHPLSQTLFTSLYLDRLLWPEPKGLGDATFSRTQADAHGGPLLHVVLRAYCVGLVKTCDFVHKRIGVESCYEEEDFVTHLYNRSLLSDFSQRDVSVLLHEALVWLEEHGKHMGENLRNALQLRLDFRSQFLKAVAADFNSIQDRPNIHWSQCSALLLSLEKSAKLGKKVEEAFSVKIQRKLASTIPPRPIVNISFDDAMAQLKRLCVDGNDVQQILEYHGVSNMLNFVWMMQSRKPQPSVYIRALLQSFLFEDLKILGQMSVKQMIFDDLAEIVLPADMLIDPQNSEVELPSDPRFQISRRMDEFVQRAAQCYIDFLRAMCQNRCRIRRTLCHTIVDFDNLQLDAEEIDNELRIYTKEEPIIDRKISDDPIYAFPLSSWAYYYKLQQMEWIVQLGFELDVYRDDELASMYWYLQHLIQTRVHHLSRIRGFTTRRLARLSKPTRAQKDAFASSLSFINVSMLEASATQGFADALSCLYTVFLRLSLLPAPFPLASHPYSTDALRFDLRMKPFLLIGLPSVPEYATLSALVAQPHEPTTRILAAADTAVSRARKDWELLSKMDARVARVEGVGNEWSASIKNALRSGIATSIAISTLRKSLTADAAATTASTTTTTTTTTAPAPSTTSSSSPSSSSDSKPTLHLDPNLTVEIPPPGKRYHEWWIVPRVVKA
ncbi:MAG: hypothetical protein M1819_001539 [Sarea resinae]|nr:MAG: hypothetical protein M1819_001539 [Sarea resinae]